MNNVQKFSNLEVRAHSSLEPSRSPRGSRGGMALPIRARDIALYFFGVFSLVRLPGSLPTHMAVQLPS